MDTRLTQLADDLQLQLPGVVLGAVQRDLRNTLRDFFTETNLWQENVPFPVKPDVLVYEIIPDTPSIVVRMMGLANADGRPVRYATMIELGTLMLQYAPSQIEEWTATVALTINGDTDRDGYPIFPLSVLDRYYDVILQGTLARMMVQSAKPYANPQMAGYYQKRYLSGKAQARHDASMENVYGGQRWRYPGFAGSRRGGQSSFGPPQ